MTYGVWGGAAWRITRSHAIHGHDAARRIGIRLPGTTKRRRRGTLVAHCRATAGSDGCVFSVRPTYRDLGEVQQGKPRDMASTDLSEARYDIRHLTHSLRGFAARQCATTAPRLRRFPVPGGRDGGTWGTDADAARRVPTPPQTAPGASCRLPPPQEAASIALTRGVEDPGCK